MAKWILHTKFHQNRTMGFWKLPEVYKLEASWTSPFKNQPQRYLVVGKKHFYLAYLWVGLFVAKLGLRLLLLTSLWSNDGRGGKEGLKKKLGSSSSSFSSFSVVLVEGHEIASAMVVDVDDVELGSGVVLVVDLWIEGHNLRLLRSNPAFFFTASFFRKIAPRIYLTIY